jgi:NMD protein affecting ribosome stability and mRNA decay
MKCERCGKETGEDWKTLCYSCYKQHKAENQVKCSHCGRVVDLDDFDYDDGMCINCMRGDDDENEFGW